MKHFIFSFACLAMIYSASAFMPANQSNSQQQLQENASKTVLTLSLQQTGQGEIFASWTVAPGSGPYNISVIDLNTGIRVYTSTTNLTFHQISGLTGKHYRVSVGDVNIVSQDIMLQ